VVWKGEVSELSGYSDRQKGLNGVGPAPGGWQTPPCHQSVHSPLAFAGTRSFTLLRKVRTPLVANSYYGTRYRAHTLCSPVLASPDRGSFAPTACLHTRSDLTAIVSYLRGERQNHGFHGQNLERAYPGVNRHLIRQVHHLIKKKGPVSCLVNRGMDEAVHGLERLQRIKESRLDSAYLDERLVMFGEPLTRL
jgi:hypothetical protein